MMEEVLSRRLAQILNQSVEEYIKSAAPISSGALANKPDNKVSSATIRNDLKMLEQLGYLHQLHTSGGRVPTTMGFRAYVDMMDDSTFAGDLINDLAQLAMLVERIDRKIGGGNAFALKSATYDSMLERRQNIYKLLEVPDLEMSAFYLLIKERMDGRR